MQTMTRTDRRPFRAAITENGLVPTKRCEVLANHGYYFGGSSSPSFVLVLAVTAETVVYCDTYKLEPRSEQRWIFEDLATRAGETMRQHARQAAKDAETAEIDQVQEIFALPDLAVEDTPHGHQRPKFEEYGEVLFVALHLLEQLDWLTPMTLEELRGSFLNPAPHLRLEVIGELRFD